ncbi:hypothetical protein BRCON_1865 [Candidatus Sumerlaea chitinivorans]|uniref:Uncharacterized protein n=1 Tax=Sumerlaea chitinivorans TaxID=2250252 RepID=A0A2Z4Y7L9_SUMC1|nr:hypothetical protein BRCON_1865 [Candidatus Sumerlaea chitinivorans]
MLTTAGGWLQVIRVRGWVHSPKSDKSDLYFHALRTEMIRFAPWQ